MPTQRKKLDDYSSHYFNLFKQSEEINTPIPLPSHKEALAMRKQLYAFRDALFVHQHPLADLASEMIFKVSDNILTVVHRPKVYTRPLGD
tara:strand:- start:4736 stop:5005 length:270 start_codon:yes stop_codon:yes gene_type:complete